MRKIYKVNITQRAQNDLEQIFYYIAADNIKNASNFVLKLEEMICSLDSFPERHPFIPENNFFNTEYRHFIYKTYRIVYRISNDSVFIMRVFHGSKLLDI